MKYPTELMHKLGIQQPIVLGPMMGVGTPEMVAAVTNMGGLGSFAASALSRDGIRAIVNAIREKTQGPFNINLFVQETPHPTEPELQKAFALLNPIRTKLGLAPATPLAAYCEDFRAQLEVLIELKLPVVSFTFGLLDAESVERLHRAGSVVIGTATPQQLQVKSLADKAKQINQQKKQLPTLNSLIKDAIQC